MEGIQGNNNNDVDEQAEIIHEDGEEECKLPEDVVTQHILPWLPIKPLTKFKLVSKEWYSLISSSEFINKHFKLSLFSDNPCSPAQYLFIKYKNHFYLYDGNNVVELDASLMFEDHKNNKIRLNGSSNGLICLAELHGKLFILWNPAINVFHKFYAPDYEMLLSSRASPYCNWGFGYVSSVDDYKTVRVILGWNGENTSVHVHSLKTNTWKKIGLRKPSLTMLLLRQPKLVNETVYWSLMGMGRMAVIGFDLVSEEFGIPAELCVKSQEDFPCVLGGCLGVCGTNSNNDIIVTIYKGSGKVASVRLLSDASLYDYEDMMGFVSGMICAAKCNPQRIDLIDSPTSKKTLMSFPDYGDLSIENYVPTQVSPIPSGEEPNASASEQVLSKANIVPIDSNAGV